MSIIVDQIVIHWKCYFEKKITIQYQYQYMNMIMKIFVAKA